MTLKQTWPSVAAFVGNVRFEQYAYSTVPNPMDAHCSLCDWAEPWEGNAMVEHIMSHGQEVGCVQCAVATLNLGLDALCTAHGGPKRCPSCQAYDHCYSSCTK